MGKVYTACWKRVIEVPNYGTSGIANIQLCYILPTKLSSSNSQRDKDSCFLVTYVETEVAEMWSRLHKIPWKKASQE